LGDEAPEAGALVLVDVSWQTVASLRKRLLVAVAR
jgi:hypothetical protein